MQTDQLTKESLDTKLIGMNPSHNDSPRVTGEGSRSFGRLIMQLKRLERQPRTFGAAGKLTPSEIHAIDAVGPGEAVPMGGLAARLGVTKGAITQLIDRLEGKGLVSRRPHPQDSRSALVALTELGKEAYAVHEQLHAAFYERLRTELSEQELEIFEKSIAVLSGMLNDD